MKPLPALILLLTVACTSAQSTATPSLPTANINIPTVTNKPPTIAPTKIHLPATPTYTPPLNVTFAASDGVMLTGVYYPPAPDGKVIEGTAPAVLLVPMVGGSAQDWAPFARRLQSAGFAALALNWRPNVDWGTAAGDVRAGWEALVAQPDVSPNNTAIIGASIGANLALITGANNPKVLAVIALSPGLDYHSVQPESIMGNFGTRSVFILASQDDAYAYDSSKKLAAKLPNADTHYFTNAGHGTEMFRDSELTPLLIQWLGKQIVGP